MNNIDLTDDMISVILFLSQVAESMEHIECRCRQLNDDDCADLARRIIFSIDNVADNLQHKLADYRIEDGLHLPEEETQMPGELRLVTIDGSKIDTQQSD